MTIPKFRAAIVVFLVGFALGLSVFVASRLFVRAVLTGDAIAAAQELATELAEGNPVETSGTLSAVVRYTYFDLSGNIVASDAPGGSAAATPMLTDTDASRLASITAGGGAIIEDTSLLASLFGLSKSAMSRVAVP